jgi:site-specific DNA-methyltransferase (adenine-specific)
VYEPVYGHWLRALEDAGFRYRTTIFRRYHAGRGTARGSVDSPSATHTFAPLLAIIVVFRGEWLRRDDGAHDLGHDDWLELAGPRACWTFPGARDTHHPAPFPEELVRRCLQLYSYRGDLIVDPFCGRGTTPAVAVGLGRRIRASDLSSTYVELTRERVALARAAVQR